MTVRTRVAVGALRRAWASPGTIDPQLALEARLVAARWLGIATVGLALPFLSVGVSARAGALLLLVMAAAYNAVVALALRRRPERLRRGQATTLIDSALTFAMVVLLDGSFDSPVYPLLISVAAAAAARYGYGVSLRVTTLYLLGDALLTLLLYPPLDGRFLIRSGFLLLIVLLVSYVRAQLRASELRLRLQYRHLPLPTYTWQRLAGDFVLVDCNDAAQAAGGDPLGRLGRPVGEVFAGHAALDEIAADLERCAREGRNFASERREDARGQDRELVWTHVFVPPDLVMVHVEDVTAQRGAERHREELQRTEKLRALGQLASGVAHDLNQALAMVAGYSDLAGQRLRQDPPDTGGAAEALAVVAQAGADGGETVKRLLLFGRGAPAGEQVPVDVATLLWEVARLTAPRWRDAAQAQGCVIRLDVEASEGLFVAGSPASLREALTSMVFNAVDALPDGGTIRLGARAVDRTVRIEVADSGVGMPPEVQARAFEPFFTTKGERGSGLGLAMVFGIVEQHGGAIRVDTAPNRGTTFWISLPAAAAPSAPAAPKPERIVRGLRVLAVDDEPALCTLVASVLRPAGHAVTTACSGEEALERLASESFDVVVSDLSMGEGLNGWELCRRVQRDRPGLPFVLVTGWGASIGREEARAGGVSAVIAKPYRLTELQRVLATVMDGRGSAAA